MTEPDAAFHADAEPEWLHSHAHEPNLVVPPGDGSLLLVTDASHMHITPAWLSGLPQTHIEHCYIVSTGHGISGPFRFGGVRVADLLAHVNADACVHVDVVAADGFGTRLTRAEIADVSVERPPLLALTLDGDPLTRAAGLLRLIVPTETDDALKQVKWVARIEVR